MKLRQLTIHNIKSLDVELPTQFSIGISGWSGSGKSSFCQTVADEAIKRLVTILPKTQYSFAFPDLVKTNFGALRCGDLPCIEFLDNQPAISNARSTVGTHTSIFKEIRTSFSRATGQPTEFFSFNTPLGWCATCKGRGALRNIPCADCNASRYAPSVREFRILLGGELIDISTANRLSLVEVLAFAEELGLSDAAKKVGQNAVELGIGYLGLDRTVNTLSGGEFTRLLLAERLGLSARMLFILDEPGLGLDERATSLLLGRVAELGQKNQLWIVDHSQQVLSATEYQLHFGPGSGDDGGHLVNTTTVVLPVVPQRGKTPGTVLDFGKLHCRNIALDSLRLPTGAIVAITGESGSGKTTLMRDLIVPQLQELLGPGNVTFIGQGRSKAVTSLSTLATFLGITASLRSIARTKRQPCTLCHGTGESYGVTECEWCMGTGMDHEFYRTRIWNGLSVRELLEHPITETIDAFSAATRERATLDFLIRFGAGYLSLGRKVRTLSTGEFQRVHLARELAAEHSGGQGRIFLLDEPSRGLSQNFLNTFAASLRQLVNATGSTVYLVEHNTYLLDCADFVVDFGVRKPQVTELKVLDHEAWAARRRADVLPHASVLRSQLALVRGISIAAASPAKRHEVWEVAAHEFEAGLLRTLSPTARWIYGTEGSPAKSATIALDFEGLLYSEDTFLFEVCDLAGKLMQYSGLPADELARFDYMDRDRLCQCCRGTGWVETFDFRLATASPSKGLWQGLLHKEVMAAIRKWNFDKIKFLFAQIKTTTGLDLARPSSQMSEEERRALWYGLWNQSFHWREKDAVYTWRGLDALIRKYMRYAQGELKAAINESKHHIECPVCQGNLLAHSTPLLVAGIDIRQLLHCSLAETIERVPDEPMLRALIEVAPLGAKINDRIAAWPRSNQVRLKLLELRLKQLFGYRFVFRHLLPWIPSDAPDLHALSMNNAVVICDGNDETEPREKMFAHHPSAKPGTLVRDLIGFASVNSELKRLRRTAKCTFCSGSGRFEVENPEGALENVYVPCDACSGEGLTPDALETIVASVPAHVWLNGTIGELPASLRRGYEELSPVRLSARLAQLPKYQLALLLAKWN